MSVVSKLVLGAACLLLTSVGGPANATEVPLYTPVQTERESQFVHLDLGLKDELARLESRTGRAPVVEYATMDLDADGEHELFIRVHQGRGCADTDCITLVFSKSQDRWVRVLETNEPEVTVTKQMRRGYRDLLVGSWPWSWAGKAYAAAR
jgi:hypothetical protein